MLAVLLFAKKHPISDFGVARLCGVHEPAYVNQWDPNHLDGYELQPAIALINNELIPGTYAEFMHQGLSELEILARFTSKEDIKDVSGSIFLPNQSVVKAIFEPEDIEYMDMSLRPRKINEDWWVFSARYYKAPGIEEPSLFFVPPKKTFLCNLRFAFNFSFAQPETF